MSNPMQKLWGEYRKLGMKKFFSEYLLKNKTPEQTILKNTFWLFLAEFASKGILFIIAIILAKSLGPNIYGRYAYSLSLASIVGIFADFGLNIFFIRNVSINTRKLQEYFKLIFGIKIIFSIITVIFVSIILALLKLELELTILTFMFVVFIILNSFCDFFRATFRIAEQMQEEFYTKIIQSGSLLILIILTLFLRDHLLLIGFAYLISGIISIFIIYNLIKNKKYVQNYSPKISLNFLKIKISSIAWIGSGLLFVSVFYYIDRIMLNHFGATFNDIGNYSVAFNVLYLNIVVLGVIASAIFPRMSKIKNFKIKKYLLVTTSYSIIIYIFFIIFRVPIITILFGKEYSQAINYLPLLLIALIIIGIRDPFTYKLISRGLEKKYSLTVIVAASINILINILLIPAYGVFGAIIATIISEAIILIMSYGYYTRLNQK